MTLTTEVCYTAVTQLLYILCHVTCSRLEPFKAVGTLTHITNDYRLRDHLFNSGGRSNNTVTTTLYKTSNKHLQDYMGVNFPYSVTVDNDGIIYLKSEESDLNCKIVFCLFVLQLAQPTNQQNQLVEPK